MERELASLMTGLSPDTVATMIVVSSGHGVRPDDTALTIEDAAGSARLTRMGGVYVDLRTGMLSTEQARHVIRRSLERLMKIGLGVRTIRTAGHVECGWLVESYLTGRHVDLRRADDSLRRNCDWVEFIACNLDVLRKCL